MRKSLLLLLTLSGLFGVGFAQRGMQDKAGAKDPALFTRLPNYYLFGSTPITEREFDAHMFYTESGKVGDRKSIEGHLTTYHYVFDRAAGPAASAMQIMRNYQNAAATLGGKILHEGRSRTTIVISKGGKETWVEVGVPGSGEEYTVIIVERQAMQQEVKANAAVFQAGLAQNGHVEVPGIYFDTAKSDLKPESDAALKEVARLLQENPNLKVSVVGHTDNTGQDDANMVLSQARAASVVKALVGMGIAPARLVPHGAGPFAPVAPNTTEDGRAKNRRVELVARQ
jgi:OmpA-OmpF porin, OOP family